MQVNLFIAFVFYIKHRQYLLQLMNIQLPRIVWFFFFFNKNVVQSPFDSLLFSYLRTHALLCATHSRSHALSHTLSLSHSHSLVQKQSVGLSMVLQSPWAHLRHKAFERSAPLSIILARTRARTHTTQSLSLSHTHTHTLTSRLIDFSVFFFFFTDPYQQLQTAFVLSSGKSLAGRTLQTCVCFIIIEREERRRLSHNITYTHTL